MENEVDNYDVPDFIKRLVDFAEEINFPRLDREKFYKGYSGDRVVGTIPGLDVRTEEFEFENVDGSVSTAQIIDAHAAASAFYDFVFEQFGSRARELLWVLEGYPAAYMDYYYNSMDASALAGHEEALPISCDDDTIIVLFDLPSRYNGNRI